MLSLFTVLFRVLLYFMEVLQMLMVMECDFGVENELLVLGKAEGWRIYKG